MKRKSENMSVDGYHVEQIPGREKGENVEYQGLTKAEAHALAEAALDESNVLGQFTVSGVFAAAYAIQRYLHQTENHDRVWSEAEEFFEYLMMILVHTHPDAARAFVHLAELYEQINEEQRKGK